MPRDIDPIRDILLRTTARYLTVTPQGLVVDGTPRATVEVQILAHGGARSLYRGKKPVCRSLDAVKSLRGQLCAECTEIKHCTPQVRVDLLLEGLPYRLLLAYTSAKHFLLYDVAMRKAGVHISTAATRITVTNRGSWGELHFLQA